TRSSKRFARSSIVAITCLPPGRVAASIRRFYPRFVLYRSGKFRVRAQREELLQFVVADDTVEHLGGFFELAAAETLFANFLTDFFKFLGEHLVEEIEGDLATVLEDALWIANPLPNLCAGDLGGGGVLHEVVERDASVATQPGFHVLDADADVCAQAGFRYRAFGDLQQIVPGHV